MMVSSGPLVTVVAPVHNRVRELPRLVKSLSNQLWNSCDLEVILVDDGSTDGSADAAAQMAGNVSFSLKILRQENLGPGPARNAGIAEARGELILLIDSDCEAHPNWIRAVAARYREEPFDLCGGPDHAPDDSTSFQFAVDVSMTSFLTTGGLRGHGSRSLARFYPRTHNMGLTRDVFRRVGGFGTLRHGQDVEFSYRVHSSGATVAYIPEAIVFHRRRDTFGKFFKQVFNWGVARVNLWSLHPGLLEPLHVLPSLALLVIAALILEAAAGVRGAILGLEITGVALVAFAIAGGFRSRSPVVAAWLLAVAPIQVLAYGMGFLAALFRRFLNRSSQAWPGFSKRYYQ